MEDAAGNGTLEQFLKDNPDVTIEAEPARAPFTYGLNERVVLLSGEEGFVIGRAEHAEAMDSYFLRYVTAEGSLVESWWSENAILSLEEAKNAVRVPASQTT